MFDLYTFLCIACFVTLLREHFGSLRRAVFKGIVQLVLLHRAFNVVVGLVLTVLITCMAMLACGPTTRVVEAPANDSKRKPAQEKEEPFLPV